MTTGSEESSVLFSLKELMTIEEDRIASEETDRVEAVAAVERARVDAERAAHEAEQARINAAAERRRLEAQRQREDETRLAAIRRAEVAKVHAEAAQRARMEAMAAQQEHERGLAALTQDRSEKRLRNAFIGISALAIAAGGFGIFWYVHNDRLNERRRLITQQEQRDRERELERAAMARAQSEKRIAELQRKLTGLQADSDEAQRLRAQLDEANKSSADGQPTRRRPASVRRSTAARKAVPAPTPPVACALGDPLCSDI